MMPCASALIYGGWSSFPGRISLTTASRSNHKTSRVTLLQHRLPTSGIYAWKFEARRTQRQGTRRWLLHPNDLDILIDAALHARVGDCDGKTVAPFITDGRLVRVIGRLDPPFLRLHLYYP